MACHEPDPHPVNPGALVRLFLLPAVRGRGFPGRLGLPVPPWRLCHSYPQVSGLSVLVDPHSYHYRRSSYSGNQRRVSASYDNISALTYRVTPIRNIISHNYILFTYIIVMVLSYLKEVNTYGLSLLL